MTELLYLEDMYPGRQFASAEHAVDAEQIIAFARLFDPQPFHLDAAAARASLFGGLVASGWHTAAITMRLLVTSAMPIAGGLIGMKGEIEWPKPVRPGDILQVKGEVIEVAPSQSKSDRGTVTVRSETLNQNGEAVQSMTAKLLVFRRNR